MYLLKIYWNNPNKPYGLFNYWTKGNDNKEREAKKKIHDKDIAIRNLHENNVFHFLNTSLRGIQVMWIKNAISRWIPRHPYHQLIITWL